MSVFKRNSASEAEEKLKHWLASLRGPLAVGLSGGMDSGLLFFMAVEFAPYGAIPFTAITPFFTWDDKKQVERICEYKGVPPAFLLVDTLQHQEVANNRALRCYFCKKMIYEAIVEAADRRDCRLVADGTVLDDLARYRPGIMALKELGIETPLADSGLRKSELMEIAGNFGWSEILGRDPVSCLATSLEPNNRIDHEILQVMNSCFHGTKSLKNKAFS